VHYNQGIFECSKNDWVPKARMQVAARDNAFFLMKSAGSGFNVQFRESIYSVRSYMSIVKRKATDFFSVEDTQDNDCLCPTDNFFVESVVSMDIDCLTANLIPLFNVK